MIRINLLPFRAARRKENIKRQITVYSLSVILALVVMGYLFLNLNGAFARLKNQRDEGNKELSKYAVVVRKIKRIEKRVREIQVKLGVIKELEKNKTGPVYLLDEISMGVPKNRLWLTSLKERGGTLTLTGTAMDNDTVAAFMTNLENSKHVTSVDLRRTRLRYLKAYKLNVSDFVLVCKTYSYKQKKKTKKGGRKRR